MSIKKEVLNTELHTELCSMVLINFNIHTCAVYVYLQRLTCTTGKSWSYGDV